MLSPPLSLKENWKTNNASCVLKITTREGLILLTGDIEKRVEKRLLKIYSAHQLSADLLVVPHHGSSSSSTFEFIHAVDPKVALFALGYKNRFGFPKQTVMKRYHEHGVETYLSALCGAMEFNIDGEQNQWNPQCFRQAHSHFWQTKNKY